MPPQTIQILSIDKCLKHTSISIIIIWVKYALFNKHFPLRQAPGPTSRSRALQQRQWL